MPDVVRYEVDGRVAWITIDRPEARNAINREVGQGLWEAFRRFDTDEDAFVAVLTGAGDRAFCAGADLKEMSGTAMRVPPADLVPHLGRNLHVAKPVIAAVNGVAYAGGFLLAQMCDLCVASTEARFAITEAKVGRGMPWAAPLPWLVPPRVAMELLLTAEPMGADRAREVGLVNVVVEPDELRSAAQRLASTIAANAPLTVGAAKQLVWAAAEHPLAAAFEEADRIFEPVYLSDDAQEGPRAFLERRPPRWTGR